MVHVQPQATQVASLSGGQQTLHHVNVSIPPAVDVEQQLLTAQSQQQQQQPGTTTVVQLLEGSQGGSSSRGADGRCLNVGGGTVPATAPQRRAAAGDAATAAAGGGQPAGHHPRGAAPGALCRGRTAAPEGEAVEFRHIPESESISRSISPIAASLQSAANAGVSYSSHAQQQTVSLPTSSSSSAGACVLQPPASGAIETVGTTVTLRNLQSNMPVS